MGKKCDLSDFEHGMIVGARQAGLNISETADLPGLSYTKISWVCRESSGKDKISSEWQFSLMAEVRGEWPDCSIVTRSQSKRALLGCGGTEDLHHGCATDKFAATV